MITLALHIIKTNPFTCLHFLQATCLVHTLKRSGWFAPTRFNQSIRIGGGEGCKSKQHQLIHLFKTFSNFKRLRKHGAQWCIKMTSLHQTHNSQICLPGALRGSQDMKNATEGKLMPWLALRTGCRNKCLQTNRGTWYLSHKKGKRGGKPPKNPLSELADTIITQLQKGINCNLPTG